MGSKEIGGFLVLLVFSNFCASVISSSPLHQETLPPDFTQGTSLQGTNEEHGNVIGERYNTDENSIKHNAKLQHKIGHSSGARIRGRPSNSGERGGSNGNRTPAQGGTNFIPVYAAGSASNRHPSHRSAARCNRIGAVALFGATMASFLQVYVAL